MRISNGNFLDEDGNEVNLVELLRTGKATPVVNNNDGHHMSAHSGWFTDENGTPVNIVALIDAAIDEDGGDDEPPIGGISINGGNIVTPDENGIINLTISGDGSTVIDSELSASSTNPVQNKVVTDEINEVIGSLGKIIPKNLAEGVTWINGRAIQAVTGSSYSSLNTTAYTDFIDISKCSRIMYMRRSTNQSYAPTSGMAFYDSNLKFISGVPDGYKSSVAIPKVNTCVVPENAVYARFTYTSTEETLANYPFFVYDADLYEAALETKVKQNTDDISSHYNEFIDAFPTDVASGEIASFSDGADDIPVKNLTVNIEPAQSGTGDPSPDNVRPISGWTGVNLTCNNDIINVDWTDEVGKVFGGTLNVTTGVLTKTHVFSELPLTGWSVSGVNFWHNQSGMSLSNPAKIGYCSHYLCNTGVSGNKVIIFGNSEFSTVSRFIIRDNSFATASNLEAYLSAQKEAGTPVTIAYPLATPVTYQLTPQEVKTILGENNIFADTGDVSVEYRADIKKYIDKVIATAISALS